MNHCHFRFFIWWREANVDAIVFWVVIGCFLVGQRLGNN